MHTTMEGGTLNEDTENLTLRTDVACVLIECHKDQPAMFGRPMSHAELRKLAEVLAERLRPRIGGRYIPKMCDREQREIRNEAVWRAFTGGNHTELMKRFSVSRRLLQRILADKRRAAQMRGQELRGD